MNILELQNEIKTNVLANFRGQECETWHYTLIRAVRKYLVENVGKYYGAQMSAYYPHTVLITYKNCTLYSMDIKRKRFQELRPSYKAQFYYNDFIYNESENKELAELTQAIDKRLAESEAKKQLLKDRATKVFLDVKQAYGLTDWETRELCKQAASIY